MTEKNKKENIREELGRAAEAMAAASLLFNEGFFKDAVSRLYYFLLYNVRALLLTKVQLRSVPALLIIRQVVFFCPKKLQGHFPYF